MAIAPLRIRVGTRGGKTTAGGHSAYIDRGDEYKPTPGARQWGRPEIDDVVARGSGNMPQWAITPRMFWDASDKWERQNGSTYREHVLTLPRELSRQQQLALLHQWIDQEIGERHAYQWAFHESPALDGGLNPHVHLMFSERQVDGIERDPEQYFRRYNSKNPQKGGCRKGYGERAGETLTQAERSGELLRRRQRWEAMVNAALEAAQVVDRVSLQSYAARGLDITPEPKLPPGWQRDPSLAEALLAFRAERAAAAAAHAELAQAEAELAEADAEVAEALAATGMPAPPAAPPADAGGDGERDQGEVEPASDSATTIEAIDDMLELVQAQAELVAADAELSEVLAAVGIPTPTAATPTDAGELDQGEVERVADGTALVEASDDGALGDAPALVPELVQIGRRRQPARVEAVGVLLVVVGRVPTAGPVVPVAIDGYRSALVDGGVEYRREADLAVSFVDHRDRVTVCVLDRDALRAALTLAAERWGPVRIDGTPDFVAAVRQVASELGVTIEADGDALAGPGPTTGPRLSTDRGQVEDDQDADRRRRAAPIVRREWRAIDWPAPRTGRWQREAADVLAELARWREAAERLRSIGERLQRAAEDARRRGAAGADGEREDRRAGQLRGLLASLTVALLKGVRELRTRVGSLIDRLRQLMAPAADDRKDEAAPPAAVPRKRRPMTLFQQLQAEAAERAASAAASPAPDVAAGAARSRTVVPVDEDGDEERGAAAAATPEHTPDPVDDREEDEQGQDDWSVPGM